MREIASIELHTIVQELQALKGMYLKKFYELGEKQFKFTFSGKEGSLVIYCKLVKAINRTNFSEEVHGSTQFASSIRKRLLGARLTSIKQCGIDRILIMDFSSMRGNYSLIIEMFGKGNLVLVHDGIVQLAYSYIAQKERSIKPKLPYAFPNECTAGYESIDEKKTDKIIESAELENATAIKALLKNFDVGPLYVENILNEAAINPKGDAKLIKNHEAELKESIKSFIRQISSPKPRIYYKEGKAVDYAILPIKKYEGLEFKEYPTLSELLDAYYVEERGAPSEPENKRIKEIEASLERQKELLQNALAEEKKFADAGMAIMNHMAEINEVIGFLREHKNITLEELKGKFNNIKELDLKNKRFTIILE